MAAPTAAPAAPQRMPEKSAGARLLSLDVYRGFIMLLLVSGGFGFSVLRNYPNWAWLSRQVDHAAWEGCTFWDLIQPAFTFMVGVAMPFAFARRLAEGAKTWGVFRHVAWRALILIALSNIYSNWGSSRGHLSFQLINVLCQIAFGYMLCYWIMRLSFKYQVLTAVAMLAGYWALCRVPRTGRRVVEDREHRRGDRPEGAGLQLLRLLHHHQLHRERRYDPLRLLGGDAAAHG